GWLNPGKLCQQYLSHPNIQLCTGQQVSSLQRQEDTWLLLDASGAILADSSHVLVASSVDAPRLLSEHHYQLFPNRGQLTQLSSTPESAALNTILCGKGYLLPAINGVHCLGSSFHPRCEDTAVTEEDHRHNLSL